MSGSTTAPIVNDTTPGSSSATLNAGTYEIVAFGAQGGSGGGTGAEIGGEVTFASSTSLTIDVGGGGVNSSGGDGGGGGGGGSFVVASGTPLVVAGGGGGNLGGGNYAGGGEAGSAGSNGRSQFGGAGGSNGGGGNGGTGNGADATGGGGGGGFKSAGTNGNPGGFGGQSFTGGLSGGAGAYISGGGGFGGGGGGAYGGGGGGGGYSGGGGGGGFGSGGGGGSFLATNATNPLRVAGSSGMGGAGNSPAANGSVTITELFASTIAVSGSGQTTTTGTAAVTPFTGVSITDPNPANPANPTGPTDTVTVTPSSTTSGTLSDTAGGMVNSSTDVYTASGTVTQVNTDLAALTFTPASGQTGKTTFTIADTNWANLTSTPGTTSVTVSTPAQPSTIKVPPSDQPQTTTGTTPVTPLTGVAITDPNAGGTEAVTVTPSSTTSGTLSDTAGGTVNSSTGIYTVSGTATQVNTDLAALTFTPAYGQFGTTTFTISDTNSAQQTSTPGTASVTVNPPTLTAAQLKQVGTDLIQFYKDDLAHKSTTADASKLTTDFTTLDISQAALGQLLGQTLTSATLASTAAATLGTDIAATYYPKITTDLAHSGQGLAGDLTAMIGTTVAAGADDLLRTHFGQSQSQALTATVQDFKLA